jgi:DNA polymerase-3 subunit delta
MVAVKARDADRYLARPPREVFLWLIHGPDEGLVRERCRRLARLSVENPDDPFQIVRLDGDDALREPGRLSDEARAIGLFGGSKALWVEAGLRDLVPALKPLIEDPPQGCVVIVEAGQLRKGAPLRTLVEGLPNGAAVESYPDEKNALNALIDEEARAAGLDVDARARAALIGLLGGDRMATRAELSKLMLYAHNDRKVTEEHVADIVAGAAPPSSDAALDAAFLGQIGAIEEPTRRAFADGVDPGVLIGAAQRRAPAAGVARGVLPGAAPPHAATLHRALLDIEAGRSEQEVLASHGRAVHFKRAPQFRDQLKRWRADQAARAIDLLAEAMLRIRREARLAPMIAVRALWSVAKAGERGGR